MGKHGRGRWPTYPQCCIHDCTNEGGYDCWTCSGMFCGVHINGAISGQGAAPQQCHVCRKKHEEARDA